MLFVRGLSHLTSDKSIHIHAYTDTHNLFEFLSLSLSRTHTHPYTHTHTRTHTNTHTQVLERACKEAGMSQQQIAAFKEGN